MVLPVLRPLDEPTLLWAELLDVLRRVDVDECTPVLPLVAVEPLLVVAAVERVVVALDLAVLPPVLRTVVEEPIPREELCATSLRVTPLVMPLTPPPIVWLRVACTTSRPLRPTGVQTPPP